MIRIRILFIILEFGKFSNLSSEKSLGSQKQVFDTTKLLSRRELPENTAQKPEKVPNSSIILGIASLTVMYFIYIIGYLFGPLSFNPSEAKSRYIIDAFLYKESMESISAWWGYIGIVGREGKSIARARKA